MFVYMSTTCWNIWNAWAKLWLHPSPKQRRLLIAKEMIAMFNCDYFFPTYSFSLFSEEEKNQLNLIQLRKMLLSVSRGLQLWSGSSHDQIQIRFFFFFFGINIQFYLCYFQYLFKSLGIFCYHFLDTIFRCSFIICLCPVCALGYEINWQPSMMLKSNWYSLKEVHTYYIK